MLPSFITTTRERATPMTTAPKRISLAASTNFLQISLGPNPPKKSDDEHGDDEQGGKLRQIPSELGRPIDQKADGAGKDQHNQFMSARKRQLLHLLTGHPLVHVEVNISDDRPARIFF